ncbi:MAG: ribbon-helix-helix protein, CopG family [Gaiellaceae bacterium]
MARAISVRLDPEAAQALDQLTRGGRDRSEAIREALVEAAARRQRTTLAAEAAELAADPEDRAEAEDVTALMESLRATR